MLALLYDIHGNLAALDAVLADAERAGARRHLVGGDVAAFGAWPAETVERLRALPDATWIRGNTDRWLLDRSDVPGDHAPLDACRDALGPTVAQELATLPESAIVGHGTVAWHASPVSDMRSFGAQPGDDEEELMAGVDDGRLVFGHTHIQFKRTAANGVELVNPGSIGLPLDGDHRAAYALLTPDGEVELRRVAYDPSAAVRALRERFGRAEWVDVFVERLEHARA